MEGIYNQMSRLLLKRDTSSASDVSQKRLEKMIHPKDCLVCHGKRLQATALKCRMNGIGIAEMCDMEFIQLVEILKKSKIPGHRRW